MNKDNYKIIKNLIFSILVIIAIIFSICIVFYDKIALTKVIPIAEEYKLTDKMNEQLQEQVLEEDKDLITTYYLDASDIKKYEKSSEEYTSGKADPFAPISKSANETENSSSDNNTNNSKDSNSTNSSGGFYNNGGLK